MQTGFVKMIVAFLISCEGVIFAQEPTVNSNFEGILSYSLNAGERDWTIKHYIKGDSTRTDIFLNDLKFQSLLSVKGEQYLIDVLGKRIVPLQQGRRMAPPSARDSGGTPPEMPEGMDPPSDADRPPPPDGGMPGFNPMEKVDPESPVGEAIAFDAPSLKFDFKVEKREVILEGIPGLGTLPGQVFEQFEDLRGIAPTIISTLNAFNLVPVHLEVEKHKKIKAVMMELVTIEKTGITDDTFEMPEGYSMQMARGGPGGGGNREGSPPGGGRGGPPPGGGHGGPPMGGGGM